MAPSWSARLPFGSSNSSKSNTSPSKADGRNEKPLPRLPDDTATAAASSSLVSPERPRTSHGTPSHVHSRSISQPLPKLFGRKKSSGYLSQTNRSHESPYDETDIPVVDGSPVDNLPASRSLSGRKKGNGDAPDTRVSRRCMCCDSKVKVPKELDKFRCMCCLTINDIKPLAKQREEYEQKVRSETGGKRDDAGGHHPRIDPPLSVERTRTIIQRSLIAYLDSRSRASTLQNQSLQHNIRDENERSDTRHQADLQSVAVIDDAVYTRSPPTTPSLESGNQFDSTGLPRTDGPTTGPKHMQSHSLPARPPPSTTSAPDSARRMSVVRKPVPSHPTRKPPPPPIDVKQSSSTHDRDLASRSLGTGDFSPRLPVSPWLPSDGGQERRHYERIKTIFRPLDDYIQASYGNLATLNTSFSTLRPVPAGRARSESHIQTPPPELATPDLTSIPTGLDALDAKTLLLGDIGENGSWWTGKLGRNGDDTFPRKRLGSDNRKSVTSRSPNINWTQVAAWYTLVHTVGQDWQRQLSSLRETSLQPLPRITDQDTIIMIDEELAEARAHTVRALLKISENLLKRPGKLLKEPEDLRWLFITLSNPSLYPTASYTQQPVQTQQPATRSQGEQAAAGEPSSPSQALSPAKRAARNASQHAGLVKRIFGLLAHSPDTSHRYVVGWMSRLYEEHFISLVDLCSSFITYRLSRLGRQTRKTNNFTDGGLIPDLTAGSRQTSAQLHSAMGLSGSNKKRADDAEGETDWATDWQIKSAAKFMSLLFAANNNWQGRRRDRGLPRKDSGIANLSNVPVSDGCRSGQLLHISTFYNTLLDYQDLITDFKVWELYKDKFAFCQYPLFLSMGAKSKILEFDARRQMETKAREAYFDQVIRQREVDGHYHLRIRRECMAEDSLRQISEAVGSGQEELKKGLRVHFAGEEGVDAGGPRKEWFLILIREVFDAEHGLFVYDDESRACYFNPNTFETSDQYYLIGAVLGLAIYNSMILDIALPSFAFRKLLAAAPVGSGNVGASTNKTPMTYTLADLAEYKPSLAAGLQKLLEFEGDVESTYCRTFVAPVERYGVVNDVPLVSNGENINVTNANRHEFVDAYIKYLLDVAVSRQFEPFKRGFFTVCAGNALSLFRAEEIELLVRGSDEALDVDSLRGVAAYENWRLATEPHSTIKTPAESEAVIEWFWQTFEDASPEQQRKLLTFITGSDRIPAVGATSLVLRIIAGGDGWSGIDSRGNDESQRYPVARTCFNTIMLWKYSSKDQLEQRLWRAVNDSEGFGLK